MALPPWVAPDEDKPAPMPLLRVQSFINTLDIESGADQLLEPEPARAWLAAAGLIGSGTEVGDAELHDARAVREGLRALLGFGDGARPGGDQLSALRDLTSRRRPAVSVSSDGQIQLGAADQTDLQDGLLGLLLTIRDAQADGTWARLKLCANPDCAWAFYDRSRNRQGTWCTMAVCGNRLKNRRFRARDHE